VFRERDHLRRTRRAHPSTPLGRSPRESERRRIRKTASQSGLPPRCLTRLVTMALSKEQRCPRSLECRWRSVNCSPNCGAAIRTSVPRGQRFVQRLCDRTTWSLTDARGPPYSGLPFASLAQFLQIGAAYKLARQRWTMRHWRLAMPGQLLSLPSADAE
jgi:hypothetical protein